jgi:hypothetical protein
VADPVADPLNPRRLMLGAAKRFLLEPSDRSERPRGVADDVPPRLTPKALDEIRKMSRFERAKATEDQAQMTSLDFAYRREQLYFEILLDIRDAMERR